MEEFKKFNFNFNNLAYKFFNCFDNMQQQEKVNVGNGLLLINLLVFESQ